MMKRIVVATAIFSLWAPVEILPDAPVRAPGPELAESVSQQIHWPRTVEAPHYAAATASDPRFDDKAVWPLFGKERFVREEWPKNRLLVWRFPGQSAGSRHKLDGLDPSNWTDTETGTSAESLPDENIDVRLPASDTPYTVDWRHPGHGHEPTRLVCRHLTIEPSAKRAFLGRCNDEPVYILSALPRAELDIMTTIRQERSVFLCSAYLVYNGIRPA